MKMSLIGAICVIIIYYRVYHNNIYMYGLSRDPWYIDITRAIDITASLVCIERSLMYPV